MKTLSASRFVLALVSLLALPAALGDMLYGEGFDSFTSTGNRLPPLG